jgi:hypothetical protein
MILNTIALGLGWIALVIGALWLLGQFVNWITEIITGANKTMRQREQQLTKTCREISAICGTEYPEIARCCTIIHAQMNNSNQDMSPQAFLTWLRTHHPKM